MPVLINHQVFGALLGAPRLDVCTLQVQGLTRFCLQLALLDEQSKGIKNSFHQEGKVQVNLFFFAGVETEILRWLVSFDLLRMNSAATQSWIGNKSLLPFHSDEKLAAYPGRRTTNTNRRSFLYLAFSPFSLTKSSGNALYVLLF